MRGVHFLELNPLMIDSVLMSKYNQPYSELDEIPTKTVILLLRLAEAESDYIEAEIKKGKGKK